MRKLTICLLGLSLAFGSARSVARADEIVFLCAGALRASVSQLMPVFAAASGHQVRATFGPIGAIAERVRNGEAADLVIVAPKQWDALADDGKVDRTFGPVVAKVGIGMFVRKGAAKPDIGSADSLKSALLQARGIAVGDPAGGSPVGAYIVALIERIGVQAATMPKLKLVKGAVAIDPVRRGEADFGFAQISEIVSVPDIELVGPLPAGTQQTTIFKAGIPMAAKEPKAAKELANFLNSEKAASVFKANGLEPAE